MPPMRDVGGKGPDAPLIVDEIGKEEFPGDWSLKRLRSRCLILRTRIGRWRSIRSRGLRKHLGYDDQGQPKNRSSSFHIECHLSAVWSSCFAKDASLDERVAPKMAGASLYQPGRRWWARHPSRGGNLAMTESVLVADFSCTFFGSYPS